MLIFEFRSAMGAYIHVVLINPLPTNDTTGKLSRHGLPYVLLMAIVAICGGTTCIWSHVQYTIEPSVSDRGPSSCAVCSITGPYTTVQIQHLQIRRLSFRYSIIGPYAFVQLQHYRSILGFTFSDPE